jgi:hypothetical protein
MFSSPTPASGSRAIAANVLRNAGLIDRDAQMLDASDNPGGRKGSSRARAHRARKKESSGASARPVSSSFLMHVLLPRDYSTHPGNNDKQCQKLGVFLGVASRIGFPPFPHFFVKSENGTDKFSFLHPAGHPFSMLVKHWLRI